MSDDHVRIQLRLFASFSELTGQRELELDVPQGTTVGGLRHILEQQYPALRAYGNHVLIAVNYDYADAGRELHSGDEVGIFPPVSGGSF